MKPARIPVRHIDALVPGKVFPELVSWPVSTMRGKGAGTIQWNGKKIGTSSGVAISSRTVRGAPSRMKSVYR